MWEGFSLETPVTNSMMRRLTRRMTAAAVAALSLGLVLQAGQGQQPSPPQSPGAPQSPAHFGTWGIDLTGMDKSVKPGEDFDRYANGAWKARTEIPSDQ